MFQALAVVLTLLLVMQEISGCSVCKPFVGGETFKECSTYVTRTGSRTSITLEVDVAAIKIQSWLTIQRRVYNGKLCGPTIRVRKGDTLVIELINKLDGPNSEGEHNGLRVPSTTNIHLHGLHISSERPGDNVFIEVKPHGSYPYVFKINKEQPAGTYWYHAHWHGSTWFQVMSGLSGMLIVEDDKNNIPDKLEKISCPDNCYNDIEILLQSTLQYIDDEDGVSFIEIQKKIGDYLRLDREKELWLQDPANGINYFTVNGLFKPFLQIESNTVKRFRIVNAGGYVGLELEVVKKGTNEAGCVIQEIAFDGVYLDKPRNPKNGQTYLTAGARVDWSIFCSEGVYELRSTTKKANEGSIGKFRRYDGIFMTIQAIPHSPTPMYPLLNLPKLLPKLPSFLKDLRFGVSVPDENKYTIEFADDFFINRQKYKNEDDFRYKMELGSIQEWTLTNSISDAPHPVHIHVNHFQIIRYNKYTGPYSKKVDRDSFTLCSLDGKVCGENSYAEAQCEKQVGVQHEKYWDTNQEGTLGYAEYGDWRDVLNLPPLSNVTVRFRAADYTGTVVIHCHVLKHEDMGMMMVVEVVPPNTSRDVDNPTKLGCTAGANCLKVDTSKTVLWASAMTLFALLYY